MKINIQQLEKKIGYSFKNKEILHQSLTHSSFAYENQLDKTSDNEILEFLGDSVLGLIAADYLCSRYPQVSEGELTKLKSAATSTLALYYFSKKIKLDKFIFLGKGEENSGGRKKKKILAGAFEALIAAIYQDGGIEEARNFLLGHLKTFYRKINAEKFFINNYKSALQEYLQKENLPAPVYKTLTTEGPNHKKTFTVQVFSLGRSLGKAKGNSKKDAEKKAAQKALKSLLGRKLRSLTSDTFLLKKKND